VGLGGGGVGGGGGVWLGGGGFFFVGEQGVEDGFYRKDQSNSNEMIMTQAVEKSCTRELVVENLPLPLAGLRKKKQSGSGGGTT